MSKSVAMNITVHRALFGQDSAYGQGYELIGTTHPDKALVRRMFNSTDLTENAPPQVSWQPALRGLPWQDFYLLLRTFPDLSPQVRGGRVYSHVLLLPLTQVAQLPDLRPLLTALPADAPKKLPLAALEVQSTAAPSLTLTPRLGYLLHEVVHSPRPGVLVWADQVGFDEAAALVWQVLGPDERQQLRFSLGFLPSYQRDPTESLTLVAVPDSLLQRWRNTFQVVETTADYTSLDEAEAWLAGLPHQSPNLSLLLQELDPAPTTPSDLDTLQRVASTAATLPKAALRDVLALATLLYHYPTRPAYHRQVLARLQQLIADSPAGELQRLGSVQETMLSGDSLRQLGQAVQARFTELASQVSTAELLPVLVNWHDEPDRAWWQRSVRAALKDIFVADSKAVAQLVFGLWGQTANLATDYLKLLPATTRTEALLLRELPTKLSSAAWQNGLKLARQRLWLCLNMRCLLPLYSLQDALAKQLILDTEPSHIAALQLATVQETSNFVAAAVALEEARLTSLAGGLCVKDPKLFDSLKVEQPGWQAVWLAAAQISRDTWANIAKPAKQVTQLLDLIRAKKPVLVDLLKLIGQSAYADLRGYPDRPQVWAVLHASVRSLFLEATAWGLLKHEEPEAADSLLETELEQLFSSPEFTAQALVQSVLTPNRAIRYIVRFAASESSLLAYLAGHRGQLGSSDAQALGQLIQRNNWKKAAQTLLNRARTEPSFGASITHCLDQLGWLDRLELRYSNPKILTTKAKRHASDDWWAALWQEASNLYPVGPGQDHLWETIGRKNYELSLSRNGGEQWRQALTILRDRREYSQTTKLLTLMLEHHSWNKNLRLLATQPVYE
jgi:hypothetical protein